MYSMCAYTAQSSVKKDGHAPPSPPPHTAVNIERYEILIVTRRYVTLHVLEMFTRFNMLNQGCGSGSAWIRMTVFWEAGSRSGSALW
jgi:hypothetical protein